MILYEFSSKPIETNLKTYLDWIVAEGTCSSQNANAFRSFGAYIQRSLFNVLLEIEGNGRPIPSAEIHGLKSKTTIFVKGCFSKDCCFFKPLLIFAAGASLLREQRDR
jgi:hypothetical protein